MSSSAAGFPGRSSRRSAGVKFAGIVARVPSPQPTKPEIMRLTGPGEGPARCGGVGASRRRKLFSDILSRIAPDSLFTKWRQTRVSGSPTSTELNAMKTPKVRASKSETPKVKPAAATPPPSAPPKPPLPEGAVVTGEETTQAGLALAARLKEERLKLALTMQAVARLAGISRQMVGMVERGDRRPTYELALRMTAALRAAAGRKPASTPTRPGK